MRYDAFISYNHAADGALAPALQDALQHLAKPWYRRRAMAVFRDETNLSASPELFEAIEDALSESRYYVLLASPGSAHSNWVGKEIGFWLATKTAATLRIVLVLTEGELKWDKARNCYDAERSSSLHPMLHNAFASEPLHIDLREARAATTGPDAGQGRNFRRLFRHPVAKIAARIRDVDPDALEGEDLRQHRRTLRVAWGAAIALLALTVTAVIFLFAARRSADEARAQTKTAQSGELAGLAQSFLTDDSPKGLAVAVAAQKHSPSSLANDALSSAASAPITGVVGPMRRTHANDFHPVAISPDGRRVATTDGETGVAVWNVKHARDPIVLHQSGVTEVTSLSFSPDGRKLAVAYVNTLPFIDPHPIYGVNVVWDLDRRARIAVRPTPEKVLSLAFLPDGVTVLAGTDFGNLVWWDTGDDTWQTSPTNFTSVRQVAVSRDGRRFATTTGGNAGALSISGGNVVVWDASTGAQERLLPVNAEDVYAGAFSPDGNVFASGDDLGRVELWDAGTGVLMATWTDESAVSFLAFDPKGAMLVSGDDNGTVVVRNASTGRVLATWTDGSTVTGIGFAEQGHAVLTGDEQGRAVLRNTWELVTNTSLGKPVRRLAFDDNGSTIAAFTVLTSRPDPSQVIRWGLHADTKQPIAAGEGALVMAASGDGRLVVATHTEYVASAPRTAVQVSDLKGGAELYAWSVDAAVDEVAITSDGKLMVTGESAGAASTLTVRDIATGRAMRKITTSTRLTSTERPQIAVGPGARTIVWIENPQLFEIRGDRTRPDRLESLKGPRSTTVVMSANGRTLASIDYSMTESPESARVVRIRDTTSRDKTKIKMPDRRPTVLALSPNGQSLAVGDTLHGVRLWEIARDGELLDHPRAITTWKTSAEVTSLAFSPDGRQLAAGDATGHVFRWDASAYLAPSHSLVSRVCHALRAYRPTKTAWQQVVPYFEYGGLCT